MGFLSGRVSYIRYRVAGAQRIADKDGIQVGWTGGEHVLDTRFDLAKNVVNDALSFAFRVDSERLPADLLRAYTAIELTALSANNPSGVPSARQKREARENAKERLEQEGKDGRFVRRKLCDLLWDAPSNELLIGTTA